MKRYAAAFLGAVTVSAFVWMLPAQPASEKDDYLTLEEAARLGMKVKLITPKPRVILASLEFTEVPQEAQLVIQDDKVRWIANTSMAINDKSCSAWLAEGYLAKSYFLVVGKPGGLTYHVPLR